MKITGLFKSIQGETSYAGCPCAFIRFCGCNLRCAYCDTKYAYYRGSEMGIAEVTEKVGGFGCSLVSITGGEPLLQSEVYPLIDNLIGKGYSVIVETNGSVSVKKLSADVVRVIDIKCPDSGMSDKMDWTNLDCLHSHDEVKYVISSRGDYEWAKSVMKKFNLCKRATVLVSVAWGRMKLRDLAEWILADKLNVRLQPQLHKLIAGLEDGAPASGQGLAQPLNEDVPDVGIWEKP